MIILGDRILVSRLEEKKKDGFQTVEVQDSFLYEGKVEQLGHEVVSGGGTLSPELVIKDGDIVLFAKYSPHTQTVTVRDQEMKIVRMEDVIAIL